MSPSRAIELYLLAVGMQQANGVNELPKSVRYEINRLVDALAEEVAEADFVAADRAKPADAEWFAGLEGVRNDHRGLLVRDAGGCVMITCIGGAFCIWSWDWPGGHPTRGQVLDAMAALGQKGGDA